MTSRAGALALGMWAGGCLAGGGATTIDAEACHALLDDALRLACYDREFGRAPSPSVQSPMPAAVPAVPAAAAAQQPPAPSAAAVQAPPAPSKLFTAKISALRFLKHGEFVATLDNGQLWRQYVAEGRPRIAVGDTVKIWPGLMGAYNLKGPTDWLTKVHPVAEATSNDRRGAADD